MPQNHFAVDDQLAALSPAQKQALLDSLLKDSNNTVQEFDLSKPVTRPYNPRDPKNEFPKMLYAQEAGKFVVVNSKEEEKKYLKLNYTLTPPMPKKPEEAEAEE